MDVRVEPDRRLSAEELMFWIMMLEKISESPLGCKEIKPVNPKGNQPQILIEKTDAEAEAPILLPPDVKNWLIGKDSDEGKDWGQNDNGVAEDEMVRYYYRPNGCESEQTQGDNVRQMSLACCSPWSCKESAMTLEKAMAPHSSTLSWKVPWMEEPDTLQSMRSLRVGQDWVA